MAEDARDGDPEVDVAQASGREVDPGSSTFDTPSGRQTSPVNDIKHRLSLWGESNLQPADSDEEGSEYELLLDPNLPEEYGRSGLPTATRVTSHSTASDEEKVIAINEDGEEDSPYPEVRAAVRNYDTEAPCNTVSRISVDNTEFQDG